MLRHVALFLSAVVSYTCAYAQDDNVAAAAAILDKYLLAQIEADRIAAIALLSRQDQSSHHPKVIGRTLADLPGPTSTPYTLAPITRGERRMSFTVEQDQARWTYELRHDPQLGWRVHLNLARRLAQSRNQAEVAALLRAAQEYTARTDYRRALTIYNRVLSIDPENAVALNQRDHLIEQRQ